MNDNYVYIMHKDMPVIRELLKSDSVMRRLPSQTKDSDYGTGTTRTLSTLIRLNADLYGNAI